MSQKKEGGVKIKTNKKKTTGTYHKDRSNMKGLAQGKSGTI